MPKLKYTLLIIFFLITSLFAVAQKSLVDSFETKALNIKINIDKKNQSRKIEPYIAFNYDFDDSVSVYENGKEIFRTKLVYHKPDLNSESFPYDRRLVRLPQMTNSGKLNGKRCQLILWKSKKIIEFNLQKNATYYVFGFTKDALKWNLNVLNVYPWPD
jgi:hypothetical protein